MTTATPLKSVGDRTIVVGIDFGTTFTGVAYASSERPDRVHVLQNWPNHVGKDDISGKVPTRLCYKGDGTFDWGALIPADAPIDEVLEYFKLALDPEHVQKLEGGSNLTKGNLGGQNVDKLVTDYLTGITTHTMQYLRRQLGDVIVNTTPFHFVLTVPAIWSDQAMQRTRDAFERAMASHAKVFIQMISEPEAAATCVLKTMHRNELNAEDCFIVVDAGGGTVDLISYSVEGLIPIIQVTEAAAGSGGACGAAFLNERFEQMLRRTLSKEDGFDNGIVKKALEKWERNVKKRFAMADLPGQTYEFDVVGLEDNRELKVRRSHWTMSANEVFRIFDGVVLEVLKLVTDQRAATQVGIKAVVLVGGFGQSTYLRERLEAHLGRDIPVLQPADAWTAVVQGAVLKGLAAVAPERASVMRVINRKARKHYGFELFMPYRQDLHAQIDHKKTWDLYSGQWQVSVMQWFLKKGDTVTEFQPFTRDFLVVSKITWGRPKVIMLTILADQDSEMAPLAVNDSVKTLCIAEADLSDIPDDQISQRRGTDGMMYYIVECQIESSYDSASTAYTLLHNGHRYNTVKTEYV